LKNPFKLVLDKLAEKTSIINKVNQRIDHDSNTKELQKSNDPQNIPVMDKVSVGIIAKPEGMKLDDLDQKLPGMTLEKEKIYEQPKEKIKQKGFLEAKLKKRESIPVYDSIDDYGGLFTFRPRLSDGEIIFPDRFRINENTTIAWSDRSVKLDIKGFDLDSPIFTEDCEYCGKSVKRGSLTGYKQQKKYCKECILNESDLRNFNYTVIVEFKSLDSVNSIESTCYLFKKEKDAEECLTQLEKVFIENLIESKQFIDLNQPSEEIQKKLDEYNLREKRLKKACLKPSDRTWNILTYLSNEFQSKLQENILDDFIKCDMYNQFSSLNEAEELMEKKYDTTFRYFPYIRPKKDLRSYIKREDFDKLSKKSQNMINNDERFRKGHDFERFFEDYCEENSLKYTKSQIGYHEENKLNPDLEEKREELYQYLGNNFGERKNHHNLFRVSGIPDYIILNDNNSESEFSPNLPAFVEVKYNNSPLRANQKQTAIQLIKEGYGVYLFRGTDEEYRICKMRLNDGNNLSIKEVSN